jgi:hypothetical protein
MKFRCSKVKRYDVVKHINQYFVQFQNLIDANV